MILIENAEVMGFEQAIRGMRNPMNSWDKSDSKFYEERDFDPYDYPCRFKLGSNDLELMLKLAKAGPVHAKYRRMITVYADITAPLYWWKEFDTYKVGTVANSCSTMHKIHDKEFTIDDFSHDQLISNWIDNNVESFVSFGDALKFEPKVDWHHVKEYNLNGGVLFSPKDILSLTIHALNACRQAFLTTKDKKFWWQMIQLLPSSYNQKRTVMFNYEVLSAMLKYRADHKLDEWATLCKWIETLPYSEIIKA